MAAGESALQAWAFFECSYERAHTHAHDQQRNFPLRECNQAQPVPTSAPLWINFAAFPVLASAFLSHQLCAPSPRAGAEKTSRPAVPFTLAVRTPSEALWECCNQYLLPPTSFYLTKEANKSSAHACVNGFFSPALPPTRPSSTCDNFKGFKWLCASFCSGFGDERCKIITK